MGKWIFDSLNKEIIACRKCPRLVAWREEVARTKRKAYQDWDYWGKPVPGFGDHKPRILVLGHAPGTDKIAQGGNSLAMAPVNFFIRRCIAPVLQVNPKQQSRDDGLTLHNMFITASGRCAPPNNKPTTEELNDSKPCLKNLREFNC